MSNAVVIKSKREAQKVITDNQDVVVENNIRQTVLNSLEKLNQVEERIDKIENKGFFKRIAGIFTGSNTKEMIASIGDLTQAQQTTIQLVLSLAIMHSKNQQALDEILDELEQSKGVYSRAAEHIEFLYEQVKLVKESQTTTKSIMKKNVGNLTKMIIFLGFVIALLALGWIFINTTSIYKI